ncbi:bifunctional phosphoribosyl-AMP cyclohydrolase/phosphoribosyl-ATP diphosphatase, partial [Klebsiella pneumoniae]
GKMVAGGTRGMAKKGGKEGGEPALAARVNPRLGLKKGGWALLYPLLVLLQAGGLNRGKVFKN